ncbi:MAG: hypothetical protein WCP60_00570, partial [bacterium]
MRLPSLHQTSKTFSRLLFQCCMVALCLAANVNAKSPIASANMKREGDGKFIPLNLAGLPVGTDADLFQGLISGSAFNVYVKEIPAQ